MKARKKCRVGSYETRPTVLQCTRPGCLCKFIGTFEVVFSGRVVCPLCELKDKGGDETLIKSLKMAEKKGLLVIKEKDGKYTIMNSDTWHQNVQEKWDRKYPNATDLRDRG